MARNSRYLSIDNVFNNVYNDSARCIDTDWIEFQNLGIVSGTNIHVSASVSPGGKATIAAGRYLFVVTGETVHVQMNVGEISGSGSPFVNGTQMKISVPETQTWAFCSAGGTGLVALSKVKTFGPDPGDDTI